MRHRSASRLRRVEERDGEVLTNGAPPWVTRGNSRKRPGSRLGMDELQPDGDYVGMYIDRLVHRS
jgi:hypothetical protein